MKILLSSLAVVALSALGSPSFAEGDKGKAFDECMEKAGFKAAQIETFKECHKGMKEEKGGYSEDQKKEIGKCLSDNGINDTQHHQARPCMPHHHHGEEKK